MELETAARKYLLSIGDVAGYVQNRVFKHRLLEAVDQTGKRAVVVYRNNGWATPDPVNTGEFPILAVKCYADPDRDEFLKSTGNAEDKAYAVWRVVNRALHGLKGVRWGAQGEDAGLMIVDCARWREPFVVAEKDRHGLGAGEPLGDSVYVYAEYAVTVANGPGVPPPPTPGEDISGWVLTGHGPPGALEADAGVEYIDLDTGLIYESEG